VLVVDGGTVVVVVVVAGGTVVVVDGGNVVVVVVGPKKCSLRTEKTGSSGNERVRLVKTFDAVTSCSTPESRAVLENGDWMPPGRGVVVMVLLGVWMFIVS
jgi:hypothetical protein